MTTRDQVRLLLAQGLSNKAIARCVGRSEGTVKCHVSLILAELGVRNRTQAALRLAA